MDNPDLDWTPPQSLLRFIEKARLDGKPLVYIGFGSITVPDPRSVTEHIVDAVVKSQFCPHLLGSRVANRSIVGGVRAIISKGWSSRMSKKHDQDHDVVIPEECYIVSPSLSGSDRLFTILTVDRLTKFRTSEHIRTTV